MSVLSLYYPVRPHVITRSWGVEDPLYTEFGFTRHNGIDLQLTERQEIRAPFDCRVTKVATQPHGSGLYVSLLSRSTYQFADGVSSRIEITFMHLSRTPLTVGMRLSVGAVIGYGGSTGRSTGPHTHMALKRVVLKLFGRYRDRDRNDAANTFDPTPYWNETYA